MRSPKPARAENPLGNTRRSAKAYLYLLPAFAVLAVFVVYPILMTLRMGFYQSYVYLTDTGTGFGLNSFRYVLQDPAFGLAVRNTMFIVLVGVPITIVLSLGAALLINSLLRTKGLFQTLYFLPYVTSTLAIGLVFRWLFHSEYGYINFFLEFLGLEPQKWLSDPNLTIVAVTIFTIWSGMAFKIVLFLAGLQKIDQQYYKAARIDGTPAHRIFFRITMPLLSPTFGWSPSFRSFMPLRPTTRSMLCSAGRALGLETAPSLWSTIFMTCFSTGDRFTTPRRRPSSFWPSYWP